MSAARAALVAFLVVVLPALLLPIEGSLPAHATWLGLVALPGGCALAAAAGGHRPAVLGGALGALAGALCLVWSAPGAGWVLAGWAGLGLGGYGLGRASGRAAGGLAAGLAALVLALELAPSAAGLAVRPPASAAPQLGALLFDLAPSTWIAEGLGLDWMRFPAHYDPAGTDWFSGGRAPYSAGLAGGSLLVVGCLLALAGGALGTRSATSAARPASPAPRDPGRTVR